MKTICLWVAILALSHGVTLAIEDRQTPLSLARMQEILFDLHDEVKKNAVPLGFIYTQYPKEKAPADIWPSMTWTEITSQYEGLFFRASGGGADTFGTIQGENVPAIDKVEALDCYLLPDGRCHYEEEYFTHAKVVDIPKAAGGWSAYAGSEWTFLNQDGHMMHTNRFHSSGGEVRPKNMAIKVWKRTA